MREPLVSILTPCYNSESFIHRMLNSVLKQTYNNIELICIDDGSTDNTIKIIDSYQERFNIKGISLKCISIEHRGQAAAINEGLKIIKGEYLTLLDSDDFLADTSIEKRVKTLIKYTDCAVVSTDYYIVNEADVNTPIGKGDKYIKSFCYQPYQFELLLQGLSSVVPLSYMIRVSAMKCINREMIINECTEGQNYQILLPMYFFYKRCYIDEPLGYYVIRSDSHDHKKRTQAEMKQRYSNLLTMIEQVMRGIVRSEIKVEDYKRKSVFYKNLGELGYENE